MDNSATMCYEVIESYNEDVEVKSYDETKTIPTNFNENIAKLLYFTRIFINYSSIIDSCYYLLLSDNM